MTTLVNANEVFTQIVSTKKRNTWSGSARAVASQVVSRSQPVKLVPSGNNFAGVQRNIKGLACNGIDTVIAVADTTVGRSSDGANYIVCTLNDTVSSSNVIDVMYFDGAFFVNFYGATGPQYRVNVSTNKGVSFAGAPGSLGAGSLFYMSVCAGKAYFVLQLGPTFYYLTTGSGSPTSVSFSRSGNWSTVFGTATKQYAIGNVSGTAQQGAYVDSATNGTTFSQDTAMQTFLSSNFSANAIKYGYGLGNGGAMIIALDANTAMLRTVYCGSDNVWKDGASIPTSLPNGNRITHLQTSGTTLIPRTYVDPDGFTYLPIQTTDTAGNYYQGLIRTYDGKTVEILDRLAGYNTTSQAIAGISAHPSIAGSILLSAGNTAITSELSSKEIYYEI